MKDSNKQESRREFGKKVLTLAVGGMFAGAALTGRKVFAEDAKKDDADKHVCKGTNACKGKGADGKNECKGKGSCASKAATHDCKGKNDCKGMGGCAGAVGKNECKGKGGCKVPVKEEHKDK